MDIVPGGSAICKVDDALFDGRLTTRFRYGDVTTMPVSFDQWGSGSGNTPLSQSDNRRIPEKSTKFESYQPVRGTNVASGSDFDRGSSRDKSAEEDFYAGV